jgi:hypothetical protein
VAGAGRGRLLDNKGNMDLQQRTDDLQHKFKTVSSPLEEFLVNAAPGNTKTYAETLLALALARETMTNYELAVRAHQAGQIRQLAASARNLLELSTWSEYCANSSDNAKRFHDDAFERSAWRFAGHGQCGIARLRKSRPSDIQNNDGGIQAPNHRYSRCGPQELCRALCDLLFQAIIVMQSAKDRLGSDAVTEGKLMPMAACRNIRLDWFRCARA